MQSVSLPLCPLVYPRCRSWNCSRSKIAAVAYDSLQRSAASHPQDAGECGNSGDLETVRTRMAETEPSELGLKQVNDDPVSSHFGIRVLDRGLGDPDLQHDVRAMGGPGGSSPGPAPHVPGQVRARQTEESADEEFTGCCKSHGSRSRRLADRCRHGGLLHVDKSAAATRADLCFWPGLRATTRQWP